MYRSAVGQTILRDENFKESVNHGSEEYPFSYYFEDVWDFDFHCIDWHWHPEVEIVYVTSGKMTAYIGTDKIAVEAGSLLFMNSGVLHRFETDRHTVIPNIVFLPELLADKNTLVYKKYISPVLQNLGEYLVFSLENENDRPAIDVINDLFDDQMLYIKKDSRNELETVSKLMLFWRLLYDRQKTCNSADMGSRDKIAGKEAKLQIMMQYIQNNYAEQISLNDIAASVLMSRSSVLKLFDEYLHMPPIAYLINYRLKRAADMLMKTDSSVSAIAIETGFNDCAYFCRKFKEIYGLTPSEYRKREVQ